MWCFTSIHLKAFSSFPSNSFFAYLLFRSVLFNIYIIVSSPFLLWFLILFHGDYGTYFARFHPLAFNEAVLWPRVASIPENAESLYLPLLGRVYGQLPGPAGVQCCSGPLLPLWPAVFCSVHCWRYAVGISIVTDLSVSPVIFLSFVSSSWGLCFRHTCAYIFLMECHFTPMKCPSLSL